MQLERLLFILIANQVSLIVLLSNSRQLLQLTSCNIDFINPGLDTNNNIAFQTDIIDKKPQTMKTQAVKHIKTKDAKFNQRNSNKQRNKANNLQKKQNKGHDIDNNTKSNSINAELKRKRFNNGFFYFYFNKC